MIRSRQSRPILLLVILLVACRPAAPSTAPASPVPSTLEPPAASPIPGPSASRTLVPFPTAAPSATSPPTPTITHAPTASPTADPYAGLTIDDLRARSYGQGQIQVLQTMAVTGAFTRSLISYPSDGLTIYGFMDVPRHADSGHLPVVIVCHGYIDPASYYLLDYTTHYADALARAGFLVLHPNYRDYGQSDSGPNLFRIGFAVDVLNLVALAAKLPNADPREIGLFGHSMGGGISVRAMTISNQIRAVVLYGAMSGDERANLEKIRQWRGVADLPELHVSQADLQRISPIHHLDGVTAAVSIHHGTADATVPPQWSADLYAQLKALDKNAEYFTYPGSPHTFSGASDALLIERVVEFFARELRPNA